MEQNQQSPLFQEIRQHSANRSKQVDTIRVICGNTSFWKKQTVFGITTPDIIQSAVSETAKDQDPLITLSELSFVASNKKTCFSRSKATEEFIFSLKEVNQQAIDSLKVKIESPSP
jgi:hypothetical protein